MKKYFFLAMLLLVIHYATAQSTQLKFDHIAEPEGLEDASIRSISQDDQGYIWISTNRGVAKYDGLKFQTRWRFKNKQFDRVAALSMITQERDYIWFYTWLGVCKYNRKAETFTDYRYLPGKDQPRAGDVTFNFADEKGHLWGTQVVNNHVKPVKFDTTSHTFQTVGSLEKAPADFDITCQLFKSASAGGRIWAGTAAGLYFYSGKDNRFHPYVETGGKAKKIRVIKIAGVPSEPGILWLTLVDQNSRQTCIERLDTRSGAFKDFSHTGHPELTASNDSLNDAYEDKHHRLWLATQNGLMLFNREQVTLSPCIPADANREPYKNRIWSIAEGKDGTLWLIAGKGVLNYSPENNRFSRYIAEPGNPEALSSNYVTSLVVDRAGVLWVGTAGAGLNKVNVNAGAFRTYPVSNTSADFFGYKGIALSPDGYCWYGVKNVLYKWKPGSSIHEKVNTVEKPGGYIWVVFVSRQGKIYFSDDKGLHVYDPVTRKHQDYAYNKADNTSISSDQVSCITEDYNGIIWIGTLDEGICAFNPATHTFKRYPDHNNYRLANGYQLDEKPIVAIYVDRDRAIWVLTINGGLNKLDPITRRFKNYTGYGKYNIFTNVAAFEDSKGRFWIGSGDIGLLEFDRAQGVYKRWISEDNGLIFNEVNDIKEDRDGYLWVATVRGFSRINTTDFSIKNFPINTVLPGTSILGVDLLKTKDNLMLSGVSGGFAVFDPRNLQGNPYPPDVHIEKVTYSNPAATVDSATQRYRYGTTQIEVPSDQNKVTFRYIALHFVNPHENQYAYKLDGYDTHWVSAGSQRNVTYTNLAPGTYTFRVKASNSDGVWNKKGDSIIIVINPHWWQTWWAWLLYVVLLVITVYIIVAYRSKKLLHDNRVLEQKVTARTEEVLQQKEEIEAQRDDIEKAFGELKTTQNQLVQREKMASLGELTAGIAHEIQNPLNFVNNFSEVSIELLAELKDEEEKGNKDDVVAIANDLTQNLEKIRHHGKRADSIVKGMLEHSRTGTGEKQPTDLNALADEYLRLSYHGLRAKDKDFNAELITHFDPALPAVNVVPQDISRVLLNLFNNAFYAVNQKKKTAGAEYKAEVSVTTWAENGNVVIKVKDNGNGIPNGIKDKIMQPFFTTKPTGEGTGLGLSLSYDIVVKGHGGSITVDTKEGEFTEFTVTLPLS